MDIYLISDTDFLPESPEELDLQFVGKFDSQEFKEIKLLIAEKSYFEDFKLLAIEVENLYVQLLKSTVFVTSKYKVTSFAKLDNIFKKAVEKQMGIAGFAN
jgi:hypothetical protein